METLPDEKFIGLGQSHYTHSSAFIVRKVSHENREEAKSHSIWLVLNITEKSGKWKDRQEISSSWSLQRYHDVAMRTLVTSETSCRGYRHIQMPRVECTC